MGPRNFPTLAGQCRRNSWHAMQNWSDVVCWTWGYVDSPRIGFDRCQRFRIGSDRTARQADKQTDSMSEPPRNPPDSMDVRVSLWPSLRSAFFVNGA